MRLRQVLTNLIGNATKFTEKGSIVLTVTTGGPAVLRFAIADTGIGIAAEVQDRLFDRYVQADTWVSRKFGGTGLGLSICKQLVELMGGRIGVISTPGEGSIFWFEVPLCAAAAPRSRTRPVAPPQRAVLIEPERAVRQALESRLAAWGIAVISAEPDAIDLLRQPGNLLVAGARLPRNAALALADRFGLPAIILSPAGMLAPQTAGRNMVTLAEPVAEAALAAALDWLALPADTRPPLPSGSAAPVARSAEDGVAAQPLDILVVEDNPVNQRVAIGMLARQGHRVVTADNGAEALTALAARRFDLVLLDRHMPVMDGIEAVQAIRAMAPPLRDIPVVALTAAATADEVRECLAAGMDDFVPKPFSPEQLAEVIGRIQRKRFCPPIATLDFDPTVLAALREALGDDIVRELIPEYIASAEATLAEMARAVILSDGKDLAYAAHSLKSASAQLGLLALQSECGAIEVAIGDGRLHDAIAQAQSLPQTFARAQARLKGPL